MSDQFFHHQIIPVPEPEAESVLLTYQVTFEFFDELRYRQAFEHYCNWYAQIAAEHQHEFQQMRQEANLLNWFSSWRR
jgi:predicted esterase YcpF (UPF0227 family)